jgi:hypothetical protein
VIYLTPDLVEKIAEQSNLAVLHTICCCPLRSDEESICFVRNRLRDVLHVSVNASAWIVVRIDPCPSEINEIPRRTSLQTDLIAHLASFDGEGNRIALWRIIRSAELKCLYDRHVASGRHYCKACAHSLHE